MRYLNSLEIMVIKFLAKDAHISLDIVKVNDISPFLIRNASLDIHAKVYIYSTCEYKDDDGIPIIISLLLNENGEFGELDYWKVDDSEITYFPCSMNELSNFTLLQS